MINLAKKYYRGRNPELQNPAKARQLIPAKIVHFKVNQNWAEVEGQKPDFGLKTYLEI